MPRTDLALARMILAGSVSLVACSGSGETDPEGDAPVVFSAEERALLETLSPAVLPPPPPDVTNDWADDPAAATFGRALFFDPRFSGRLLDGDNDGKPHTLGTKGETGKVSCAGCHVPESGFLDDRTLGKEISLGAGWGRRRAPSLLDVGQAKLLMWDGRRDTLYNQPFGVIESPVEMNSSRLFAAQRAFENHRPAYEAIFGAMPPLDDTARFPALSAELTGCQPTSVDPEPTCNGSSHGMPGDGAEYDGMTAEDQKLVTRVVVNLGKALGAYQRKLDCGPGRFDAWMHGDATALSASEQRGARLFVGRAGCVSCHSGPYFSDQEFHNVGLKPETVAVVFLDANDAGAISGIAAAIEDPLSSRGEFSDGNDDRLPQVVSPSLEGAFRTPTLRCVSQRPTYMHTGHMSDLSEVVRFFDRGGDKFGFEGESELEPLDLTTEEQADLVAFLQSLAGPGPDPQLLAPP
jgi:cytochrome c peroxidase